MREALTSRARRARAHPEHHRARGRDRGACSRTGSRRPASRSRCSTRIRRRSATIPAWPGEEVRRETLPVVIGRIGRAGGRRIVLSGHHDVVPIGDPATWTADPFGGEIRDGSLYGRGANDMKGGVAAILGALRALAATGVMRRLDGELIVALVPSEEDGGQGTLAAIRAGATGDLAIIPEPSLLDIVVAHAGAITFRLEVPGRAAHASKRREGISALANLQVLIAALEADEARRNEDETDPLMTALGLPYPTIVGTVAGGEWASTVMDRVVAEGRYGVRLGQSPEDAFAELRAAVDAACDADDFLRDHRPTLELTGARFASARVAVGPSAAHRARRRRRGRDRHPSGAPRRAVRGGHAAVHRRRRHPVRHVRPGRRPARPRRRRAGAAGRGRGVRPRARRLRRGAARHRRVTVPPAAPIATPRLRLVPLRVEDAEEMAAVLAAPSLYAFTGGEPPSVRRAPRPVRGAGRGTRRTTTRRGATGSCARRDRRRRRAPRPATSRRP